MALESHLVFARKYRPQKFSQVIYQSLAINALKNALKNNRIGHAYIFFGPRGVGKTTIARILAKRLNCENPQDNEPCDICSSCLEIKKGISNDVIEIDAASNRGIDNIRDLRENVKFSPMGGHYKIYIIDEVHMLTEASFNALLKTLEEPPPHVVFILATTEYHKIPETILSRCQDFIFKKVPHIELQSYVEELCKTESIEYDMDGIFWVAKKGDGSVRDTLSFLEQAVSFTDSKILGKKIAEMIGYEGVETYIQLLHNLLNHSKFESTYHFITDLYNKGIDFNKFIWEFLEFSNSVCLLKENLADKENLNYPSEDILKISKAIENYRLESLFVLADKLFKLYEKMNQMKLRNSFETKIFIELSFRKILNELNQPSLSSVLEKIQNLKEKIQAEESILIKETPKSVEEKPKETIEAIDADSNIDLVSEFKDKFSGSEIDSEKFQDI
jgi:DNA polymerase-3 subunit gamma/tau